jgi:hypothetical protein
VIFNVGSDETAFVMPDEWRRIKHPRRDRPDVPEPLAPDPGEAERARGWVAEARERIEEILDLPATEPEIAAAARAYLGGEPDPVGAAAVAMAVGAPPPTYGYGDGKVRIFLGAWIAERGVAFAAAAYVAMGNLHAHREHDYRANDWRWVGLRSGTENWWLTREDAKWLRTHLAAAPGDVYAAAVEAIGEHRRHDLGKLLAVYLAPTREDWVDELCAAQHHFCPWTHLLVAALGTPGQAAVPPSTCNGWYYYQPEWVATLIDGVGPEATAPLLGTAVDATHGPKATHASKERRFVLDVLASLPVDAAFETLADRLGAPDVEAALLEASRRFPVRALRLLPRSSSARAAELLGAHVRAHRDLAESVLPTLPAEARETIREILESARRLPEATGLPAILTVSPLERSAAGATPVVIKGLTAPARTIAWAPGEREEWAGTKVYDLRVEEMDFAAAAEGFDSLDSSAQLVLLTHGPDELVRPLLKRWKGPYLRWNMGRRPRLWLARYELDAHDAVLSAVRRDPVGLRQYVLPLLSVEVARSVAGWLSRSEGAQETARAWLDRHGLATTLPYIFPDALGKAGPARRGAEGVLRFLADEHGRETIVEAARAYGAEAAAVEEALTAGHPAVRPKKIPSMRWVDLSVLPPILLRDREHVLPDEVTANVLTMLAISKLDDVDPGVRVVRDLCDPASLAEFGWTLFRWWEMCGAKAGNNWALTQLGLTGDDETVRRLAPRIRAWPGEAGHAKAVTGLDILAAIGTDTALMHLHGIAQRVKFSGLKARANDKVQEVAAALGLTPEQLADRLVPTFGLDESGTLTFDYGPRRFRIGFDEQLRPTIADEDGKPRKALPKPGAMDDPELAPAAYKRFSGLKKDLRTLASGQIRRLETAMVEGRRWPVTEFRDHLAGHRLLHHLVARLVWLAETENGTVTPFRVAEDGTYADLDDRAITFTDPTMIRVAHPVHLGGDLKGWGELFSDYEILQPFAQLDREVHVLTHAERAERRLERFQGISVPVRTLIGMERHGWRRSAPLDAGIQHCVYRPFPGGLYVNIRLDPGIAISDPDDLGGSELAEIMLDDGPADGQWMNTEGRPFGDLDPVDASELLAELIRMTG